MSASVAIPEISRSMTPAEATTISFAGTEGTPAASAIASQQERLRASKAPDPPAMIAAASMQDVISSSDRKSVVEGKSVSVRVDLGGRRIIKKTTYNM